MKLSLAPLQFFWKKSAVMDFYEAVAGWPLSMVYLGETVCSKRREMRFDDWMEIAHHLSLQGKEVILSSLALIEAESELGALRRMVENGQFMIEANDLSAVQLCWERRLPFVAGSTLNLYNHDTLELMQRYGMQRFVLGMDQGKIQLAALRQQARRQGRTLPEVEVQVWGEMPLAYSARCFTARARDLPKDDCGYCCLEYPDGLELATRDNKPFLCLNGIQVLSAACCDLGPELEELRTSGVDILRIAPQSQETEEQVKRFADALKSGTILARKGDCNGFWQGKAGMALHAPEFVLPETNG